MAYIPASFPVWVLRHPFMATISVLVLGVGGGLLAEIYVAEGSFQRFGAITIALGILLFGSLASELLTRSQGTFILSRDGEPGDPFGFQNVRRALTWQTIVVVAGTLQSGFGDIFLLKIGLI